MNKINLYDNRLMDDFVNNNNILILLYYGDGGMSY